jgi:transposase
MVRPEEWMDIRALQRLGLSIKEIARRVGRSRNSVRKMLRREGPPESARRERRCKLDAYCAYVRERFERYGLSAARLHQEIRAKGYVGSASTVRRFVATLRREQNGPVGATVRFETPPGRQAQVDWAFCGRHADSAGRLIPVYLLVMVLGYSRMMHVVVTRSMKLPVLLAAMQQAFEAFGGVPEELLFDNMKQVRLADGLLHPTLADFAGFYGFAVKTHRVRRPQTKGKVERAIRYVKEGFLQGRQFASYGQFESELQSWVTTANQRLHGTTRERPIDRLPLENLAPFARFSPYRLMSLVARKADREGFVRFEGSRYSVAPEHVGRRLWVGGSERRVVIRSGDVIVAEHVRANARGATVSLEEHVAAMWRVTAERIERAAAVSAIPRWQLHFENAVETRSLASYAVHS